MGPGTRLYMYITSWNTGYCGGKPEITKFICTQAEHGATALPEKLLWLISRTLKAEM